MFVHQVCNLAGIPARIFQAALGALLVMIITQEVGWTVIQITIECSGLLETAANLVMYVCYMGVEVAYYMNFIHASLIPLSESGYGVTGGSLR